MRCFITAYNESKSNNIWEHIYSASIHIGKNEVTECASKRDIIALANMFGMTSAQPTK